MSYRPNSGPEWPKHKMRARLRRQGRSRFRLDQIADQKENKK